jgi:hypothetical protein
MKRSANITILEKEITVLRDKLDKIVTSGPMSSGEILELSKQLDELIVGYYNLKNIRGMT